MRDGHQVLDEVGRPDRSRTSEIEDDDDRGATLATIKLWQQNYNNSSLSTDDDQMRRAKINTSFSVQVQFTSAYGGALFTFLLWF
jgi:hypothetical protein